MKQLRFNFLHTAALQQHKRVMELILILLALGILLLSIAGFMTLLKKITQNEKVASHFNSEQKSSKSILVQFIPNLKYSCSPIREEHPNLLKNKVQLWKGVCHSIHSSESRQIELTITSSRLKKGPFKGFKIANEIFYIVSKKDNIEDYLKASTLSTFLFAGTTILKAKHRKAGEKQKIYLIGFGLGIGFYIDKSIELHWKNVDISLAANR